MTTHDTAQIRSGTLQGLEEFCDWLIKRGLMRAPAVTPLRSAAKQIISTVEPDNASLDLRAIDTADLMKRFETLAGHNYNPDSLRAYGQRFNRAIELYRQYLERGPTNFKPPAGRAPRRQRASDPMGNGAVGTRQVGAPVGSAPAQPSPTLIDYPFPLRSGVIAHLYLPPTLDKDDAERLAAYVRALVFEPQRQLGAGMADGE